MKEFALIALTAVAVATLVACGSEAPDSSIPKVDSPNQTFCNYLSAEAARYDVERAKEIRSGHLTDVLEALAVAIVNSDQSAIDATYLGAARVCNALYGTTLSTDVPTATSAGNQMMCDSIAKGSGSYDRVAAQAAYDTGDMTGALLVLAARLTEPSYPEYPDLDADVIKQCNSDYGTKLTLAGQAQ